MRQPQKTCDGLLLLLLQQPLPAVVAAVAVVVVARFARRPERLNVSQGGAILTWEAAGWLSSFEWLLAAAVWCGESRIEQLGRIKQHYKLLFYYTS